MTERRAPRRRPSPAWAFGAAFGAFALVLALLAVQVRAGRDSALGPGTPVATPAERPRRIVVRRIVRTTVVTHVAAADPVRTAPAVPAPASSGPAAPAPAAPAPAPAAPAPAPVAPAPAPAPPPAPVTTRAS
jgi:hypothetical protein